MIFNNLIQVSVLLVFMFSSCQKDEKVIYPESTTITIITTNDIHANIENFSRLATLIEQKETLSDEVLVVSAGDNFTGQPYVDMVKERGKPIIDLMNKVGTDVCCLGNHEFDYGQEILRKRINEADFPFLCANINSSSSELGEVPAFHYETVNGLKLCFWSALQIEDINNLPSANPNLFDNISFTHFKECAPDYKYLDETADAFIGLTHLSSKDDSVLAQVMPELDIIIGGHDNVLMPSNSFYNGVLITQAKNKLEYAGVVTLRFKKNELVERSFETVKLDENIEENTEIKEMVEKFIDNDNFKTVVGQASCDMLNSEYIGSLVTDAMIHSHNADFAIYNEGGIRLKSINQGDITYGQVLSIDPFQNKVVLVKMNIQEIKDFIIKNYLYNIQFADKTWVEYFIGGGKYNIIVDGENVSVDLYDNDGTLLVDKDKLYTVAFNDYLIAKDPSLGKGDNTESLVISAILKFLKDVKTVGYNEPRVSIIIR